MGFFSKLGKGLLLGGGAIAAPFTGGASLATVLPAIGAGASALGGALAGGGEGAAQGRLDQNTLNLSRDRNLLDQFNLLQQGDIGRANVDLERRQFQENAPSGRLSQARSADRTLNFNDAADAVTPEMIGGGRSVRGRIDPLALGRVSEDTGSLAELIRSRALSAQQAGDQFSPLERPDVPEISEIQGPGFMEKVGNVGGTIGGILDALGQNIPKPGGTPPIIPSQRQPGLPPILQDDRLGTAAPLVPSRNPIPGVRF